MTRKDYDVLHLINIIKEFHLRYPHLHVIMEPGSAFGWQTGPLVSQVVDVVEDHGYKTYMVLLWEITLPDVREHLLAYPTVELTYTINILTSVACKSRKTETLVVIVCILTTHTNELIP